MGLWVFFFLERKGDRGAVKHIDFKDGERAVCVCGAVSDPGEGEVKRRMQEKEGTCWSSSWRRRKRFGVSALEERGVGGTFSRYFCFLSDSGSTVVDGLGERGEEGLAVWEQRRRHAPATQGPCSSCDMQPGAGTRGRPQWRQHSRGWRRKQRGGEAPPVRSDF